MLTVYRASAGSGKTYTLTGEYLVLLFSSPQAYRRILAVTFTNKATDEMKGRIVEELYRLSSGQSSGYVALLTQKFRLDEVEVRKRARAILIAILHDYAAFNISTIDRFFQQTMRAFTREIGLQGGYGLELDQEQVLDQAIDGLLASLDKQANKELLGWLVQFASEKVESGSAWNLRQDIGRLSRELFKENYKAFEKELREDIADKKALEQYKELLYALIRSEESRVKETGQKALALLDACGLTPDDFKGGQRSPIGLFRKWAAGVMKEPTATFINWIGNPEAFYTAKTEAGVRARIEEAFERGLNECMREIADVFANCTQYLTAKEIVRYYFTLGILNDVSAQLAEYRQEKNILLIADTTELLNKVIAGCDAPFIYEKTGVSIDHYMIDEFQDTSGMQWENFRPLIRESLSQRSFNLIVGDVKQSIYRFRNSDWKLLDEQLGVDFRSEGVEDRILGVNWRSCRCIVEFNNAFFHTAPLLLQAMFNEGLGDSPLSDKERAYIEGKIVQAYGKLYQEVPPRLREKDGHVKVEFLTSTDEADWKEQALSRLPGIVEQLQANGYALRDIAILVRTNKEGAQVADTLLAYKESHPDSPYKYDLISDDALFVSGSSAVRFLVALLRHLRNRGEETARRVAVFNYTLLKAAADARTSTSLPLQETDFPAEVKDELYRLSRESLYEITEGLLRLFGPLFPEAEQVFIQAFMDMVHEFVQGESSDITGFLKWWDEKGARKTVTTPDAQDAIRILTVHKSKGLGFKAVLLPFGDWEIDHKPLKPVILWCHPEKAPFNRLHLVPVRYSSTLSRTIFAREYYDEKLHAYIDNLNTLYVAFTRAKEELIVFSPSPKKAEKAGCISELLWLGLAHANRPATPDGCPLTDLSARFDREKGCFEHGTWWKPEVVAGVPSGFEEIRLERIASVTPQDRLRLRLQGKLFFFDDARRKYGALMHEILSRIRVPADVAASVDRYRYAGIVTKQECDVLQERLNELLKSPEVLPWYDGNARILNEVDILSGKAVAHRPDRIVITGQEVTVVDYRFGEKESPGHFRQMKENLHLVSAMGYTEVKGFIWYVDLNKIEQVIPA